MPLSNLHLLGLIQSSYPLLYTRTLSQSFMCGLNCLPIFYIVDSALEVQYNLNFFFILQSHIVFFTYVLSFPSTIFSSHFSLSICCLKTCILPSYPFSRALYHWILMTTWASLYWHSLSSCLLSFPNNKALYVFVFYANKLEWNQLFSWKQKFLFTYLPIWL